MLWCCRWCGPLAGGGGSLAASTLGAAGAGGLAGDYGSEDARGSDAGAGTRSNREDALAGSEWRPMR